MSAPALRVICPSCGAAATGLRGTLRPGRPAAYRCRCGARVVLWVQTEEQARAMGLRAKIDAIMEAT